jgi:hypothetical protein
MNVGLLSAHGTTVDAADKLRSTLRFIRERVLIVDVAGRIASEPIDAPRRHHVSCQQSIVGLSLIDTLERECMEVNTQLCQLTAIADAARCANEPEKRVGTERQA